MKRMLLLGTLAAAMCACAGTAAADTPAPTANNGYVYKYLGASSAFDYATTAWRSALTNLANKGTDSAPAEAPFDTTYAQAIGTFRTTLLSIQFPSPTEADAHGLVNAAGAVQRDLSDFAAGRGSPDQFKADETILQEAINIVQSELSHATSTP
jgi:hypothetical protein